MFNIKNISVVAHINMKNDMQSVVIYVVFALAVMGIVQMFFPIMYDIVVIAYG